MSTPLSTGQGTWFWLFSDLSSAGRSAKTVLNDMTNKLLIRAILMMMFDNYSIGGPSCIDFVLLHFIDSCKSRHRVMHNLSDILFSNFA